jgi:hypothetical protein
MTKYPYVLLQMNDSKWESLIRDRQSFALTGRISWNIRLTPSGVWSLWDRGVREASGWHQAACEVCETEGCVRHQPNTKRYIEWKWFRDAALKWMSAWYRIQTSGNICNPHRNMQFPRSLLHSKCPVCFMNTLTAILYRGPITVWRLCCPLLSLSHITSKLPTTASGEFSDFVFYFSSSPTHRANSPFSAYYLLFIWSYPCNLITYSWRDNDLTKVTFLNPRVHCSF